MSLAARLLLCLAGLAGAAGVALSAAAAHVTGGAMLATGAQFLVLHAGATLGAIALAARLDRRAGTILTAAAGALLLGSVLFAGDLALRALADTKLLWGTAPWGGTIMILGWLGVGAGAALARRD